MLQRQVDEGSSNGGGGGFLGEFVDVAEPEGEGAVTEGGHLGR